MDKVIKISVRNLVEFALKSGSIDSGFVGRMAAAEGTMGHKSIQMTVRYAHMAPTYQLAAVERLADVGDPFLCQSFLTLF